MQVIQDINLTSNYQGLYYRDSLNSHIVSILDTASSNVDSIVLRDKDLRFSKSLYWECVDTIYENNPIQLSQEKKDELKQTKRLLYNHFKNDLGEFFNINDNILIETIDFTVSNYIDWLKYKDVMTINPWDYSNNILTEKHLLYSFTDNIDEYKHLLKKNKRESELTKELTIGIIAKGNRKGYIQSYVKDVFGFRNLLLSVMDDRNFDRRHPIKITSVINLFREMRVSKDDLTDSQIRSWIVRPLKKLAKIGSNKNGFFIIRDEEDLYESYKSHLSNYKGFFKTLEKHKQFAESSSYSGRNFNQH